MSKPIMALVVVCILSAVAAFLIRLSPSQRLEAEISSLGPEAALARLTSAGAVGQLDENLEHRLGELALAAGDGARARAAFERLSPLRDLDHAVEQRLSDIAWMAGDLVGAAAHLAEAYRVAPTKSVRRRLGGWYRSLGDEKGETRVLSSVDPALLDETEALRLIDLHRAGGRLEEISATLASLAEAGGEAADRWRVRSLDFLLDTGRPEGAEAAAREWWAEDPDAEALSGFLRTLLDRGAADEAARLAKEALTQRPDRAYLAIPLFAERGYGARALTLQTYWLATPGRPDDVAWRTVTDTAAATGDIHGIRTLVTQTRGGAVNPAAVAAALEQVLRYHGTRALLEARDRLVPAVLAEAPLLSAALAAEMGRERDLYDSLLAAADHPMADWQESLWLSFSARLRGTSGWALLLRELPPGSPLSAELAKR